MYYWVVFLKIKRSDVVALKDLGYGEGCRYIEVMHERLRIWRFILFFKGMVRRLRMKL